MEEDVGRVPDGTGLSQVEPQEGLAPTGVDPSRMVAEIQAELGYAPLSREGEDVAYAFDEGRKLGSAMVPEMLHALWQYESDLLHPPTGDSLERRLERVRKVIAKAAEESK